MTAPPRPRLRDHVRPVIVAAGLALVAAGCGTAREAATPATSITTSTTTASTTTTTSSTTTATTGEGAGPTTAPLDPRSRLAALPIDDGPAPAGYARDLFPTWKDIDGDGCDAREQALVASSLTPATVGRGCEVVAGSWTSDYDGITSVDPSQMDVDHVVPLKDAWVSGADAWTTDQRARFANDQAELWPSSASANRSKGDHGPDRWRPPARATWCRYATRWLEVKLAWQLTATTEERDALGQMLETCGVDG